MFVAPVNVRGAMVTGVVTSGIHDEEPTRKTWKSLLGFSSSASTHTMTLSYFDNFHKTVNDEGYFS